MKTRKNSNIVIAIILGLSLIMSSFIISSSFRYKKISNTHILDTWTKNIYSFTGERRGKLE